MYNTKVLFNINVLGIQRLALNTMQNSNIDKEKLTINQSGSEKLNTL